MLRRTFLTGSALSLALPTPSVASPVGIPAAPDLLTAASRMRGVFEGSGRGTVYVLFTPWCPVSPELWKASRSSPGLARLHWIPFSGGQPEGREAVERFLRDPSPRAVPQIFVKLQPIAFTPPTPLSDAQDMAIASLSRLVIRDTGRGMVTPTIIYSIGSDRVRVVPGGITESQFVDIARAAG
ncbi:hypothetical protein G6L37_03835 [Agrobacterium rubi]|nr:hypothetical protein [Agrobacterium rubi]NTF24480.1 hypothetical protein [Agrobacterium rubi]